MSPLEEVSAGAPASESDPRLREILDSLPAMVGYWDNGLRNRFANAAYLTFFGVSAEAMDGIHISELLGPELFALNEPYMVGALGGEPQLFEREIPDPHGGLARHTQASYIPDVRAGAVRGFVALVTDITRRELAERRVRELERAQREVLEWLLRAEEIDRGRVAESLHDNTVQRLAGLQVQLGRVGQAMKNSDVPLADRLVAEAGAMVSETLDQLRGMMFDLRPQGFSEHGLQSTLTELVEKTAADAGWEWSVDVPQERYSGIVEQLVFRTVREAVLDAREHSQAISLAVTLRSDRGAIYGTITDDGARLPLGEGQDGQTTTQLDATGQRLRLAGGTMTIESNGESGRTVRFSVPADGGIRFHATSGTSGAARRPPSEPGCRDRV